MYCTYIVGQAKTKDLVASTHGVQLDNAQQLHAYLVKHHSEVSSEQHEHLNEVCNNFQNVPLQCLFSLPNKQMYFQITRRKFHHYPKVAFQSTQPRESSEIPEITQHSAYAVRRDGAPPGRRSVFQRLTSCPCANCIEGVSLL